MAVLLVIADDFTGALDTGVQFVQSGARALVCLNSNTSLLDSDVDVVVVNAETRHMKPQDAYSTVFSIASSAKKNGIGYIYKKTDSALRGNVGAELSAVMDATGRKSLVFVPSFPSMNRVTKDGVLYIDGVPVSESIFSKDPFEPVRKSSVSEIVALQAAVKVKNFKPGQIPSEDEAGILLYDSATQQQMDEIGRSLGKTGLGLCAGCAGFASVLAGVLGFSKNKTDGVSDSESSETLVINGSVNPVTSVQIDTAKKAGIPVITLTPDQKTRSGWTDETEGEALIWDVLELVKETGSCVIDAGNRSTIAETDKIAARNGITAEKLRRNVASTTGRLAVRIMDAGYRGNIMCIGGDTLLALVQATGTETIRPLRELEDGVVLAKINYSGNDYTVITKSGGFGGNALISNLCKSWRR
jgi:uncharacterized protein YgbK (DUF1537 family)